MARVIIGLPLYEGVDHVDEALASLLAQTYTDFAIVACDDSAGGVPGERVREHAARDARIHYEHNPQRLGMTRNWRRCFKLGIERHPEAVHFAWASDHDAWHPRWLEVLVRELDAHPEAVLAYPMNVRVSESGEPLLTPWRFDTAGLTDITQRLETAAHGMFAGDMVYGLFRIEAQVRAGIFRSVLLPDRLLLSELAVHGEFRQVPEILWFRRFAGIASLSRQRASFWPEGTPWYGYLPWWLVHPAVLAYDIVVRGHGGPTLDRTAALPIVMAFLRVDARFELLRKIQRTHGRVGRTLSRPRKVLGGVVTAAAARGVPGAATVQTAHGRVLNTARQVLPAAPESALPHGTSNAVRATARERATT